MDEKGIEQELTDFGFEKEHIDLALKMTTKKAEAVDLIIKMIEDPTFFQESKCHGLTTNISQYKMVIMVRDDLKMGRGKIAAQVGHGVLGAYKMALTHFPLNVQHWEEYSGTAKIVVAVNSEEEILSLRDKAKEKNLPYYLVRDAGRTQIAAGTITVCAVGPAKVSEVNSVTGHLNLL